VRYRLVEDPLRLTPEIASYEVVVRYTGKAKVAWVIPVSRGGEYRKTIVLEDVPINERMFTRG